MIAETTETSETQTAARPGKHTDKHNSGDDGGSLQGKAKGAPHLQMLHQRIALAAYIHSSRKQR